MPASISTVSDVANLALKRIGYALRVGSLYEGSKAANHFLDIYGQTRDELLRQNDWHFAERNVAATVLKTAPAGGYFDTAWDPATNPPVPWGYSYTYPTDCLKVRALKPAPGFL